MTKIDMMIKTNEWEREKYPDGSIVFRMKSNSRLTYEIRPLDKESAKEIGAKWYAYPAIDGNGIPNSPDLIQSKKEALKLAKIAMKDWKSKLKKQKLTPKRLAQIL